MPVTIYLGAAERAPTSLVFGTERRPYLIFDYLTCKLAQLNRSSTRRIRSRSVAVKSNQVNVGSMLQTP